MNSECCVKIGESASETLALLTLACGEYATKESSVFDWYSVQGRTGCAR
jgi:hypothetical protein